MVHPGGGSPPCAQAERKEERDTPFLKNKMRWVPSCTSRSTVRWFMLWVAIMGLMLPASPPTPLVKQQPQAHGSRGGGSSPSSSTAATATSPLPRILVMIACHYAPGRTTVYLDGVLRELRDRYTRHYRVTVIVDTNSEALVAHLATAFPPPFVTANTWSVLELGNPLHLPYVHRHHMQQVLEDYDYFVFTEDDVLVPVASFQFYASRQRELWDQGWMFGWVRAEVWGGDNATAISIDNIEPVVDRPVYRAPSGGLYAEPWSPYCAFYALDAQQARAMVEDPSGVWHNGFPPFLPREKMSIGYFYAYTGGKQEPYGAKGWRARALVPLDARGVVEEAAIAWHLPRKYAQSTQLWFHDLGSVPVKSMFNWSSVGSGGGFSPIPLVQLPPE